MEVISSGVATSQYFRCRDRSDPGTTIYWRDAAGHVISETNQAGQVNNNYIYFYGQAVTLVDIGHGVPTRYLSYIHDHLGTTRMITGLSGVPCYDADFFPWGGEQHIFVNTCPQNYKFTGKERDPDTNSTDYFGARWYQGAMARFYSPDWSDDPEPVPYAKLDNPQSLNLYAYALDNPTTLRDEDGHDLGPAGAAGVREDSGMGSPSDVVLAQIRREQLQQVAQQQNTNQAVGNTTEGSLAKVLTNEDGSLSTPKGGNAQELVDGKTALANAIYNNADSAHPQKVAPDTGTASGQDSQIMQGVVTSRTNGGADPVQGRVYYGTSHTPNLTSRSAGNGLKGAAGRESVFARFGPFKDSISSRSTYIYIYNNPGH
jgi:RHS repeat-associated protein